MSELEIGQWVQLADGRRGEVRFIGQTHFGVEGTIWVGVELDEPEGKNDGSVHDVQYFSCQPLYGIFAKPGALSPYEPEPPAPTPIPTPAPAPASSRTSARASARASAPAPARRASRPSSLQASSQAAPDVGTKKRMSLNAPSPSPVPRAGPRPPSMTRVRVSILFHLPLVATASSSSC